MFVLSPPHYCQFYTVTCSKNKKIFIFCFCRKKQTNHLFNTSRTMTSSIKKDKTIYWISTILLAIFILPGIFFAASKMALEGTRHLGLPMWFHWELSIGKFIGGLILILPYFPNRVKEWAYVAFGIDFISAFIANVAVDGAASMWYGPGICFIILIISYIYFHKLNPIRYGN